MRVLLDTNVLSRSIHHDHPQQRLATKAIKRLIREGHELYTVPQVLFEFWVVCTRPTSANGLGLSIQQVRRRVIQVTKVLKCLPDPLDIYEAWLQCVTNYRVIGKNAHDARLVAAMKLHHITHMMTFNVQDFHRYHEIEILTPQIVLAGKN